MTDDELRDKLIDAAARDMYQREGIYEQPGCPWDDLFDSEHKFWRDTVTPTIDALMPTVREALASAWDHGHRTANPVIPDTHRDVINPWKQPGRG